MTQNPDDEILKSYIAYDEYIINSYPRYNLFDLYTAMPNGKYLLADLTEVTRKKTKRKNLYDFKFFDNLYYISKDLKYSTANLFFLRPYINNPTKENGTFFKNPFDTRYMMFVNFCY